MATTEQLKQAAYDVLAGRLPKPAGIQFDSYDELKLGVRRILEQDGILPVQPNVAYEIYLDPEDDARFRKVYGEMVGAGAIVPDDDGFRFKVALMPPPFSEKWQFLERLKGGDQGITTKVRRISDGLMGVLKVPKLDDLIPRERFIREVQILEEVDHPSIVKLLDRNLDEAEGQLGYVTPLGIPLNIYWATVSKTLNPIGLYDRAYQILREMCLGLQAIHSKGQVHRDLKPENVVMINDLPVVIDFGVAIRPGDERLSILEGRPVANRNTTPPAAHYGLHENSPAWDCFGLGCIYGFLIGTHPNPKQFHWRFHPLVSEPRENRAKAILAGCSHESTTPRDASEFLKRMDLYRLDGTEFSFSTPDEKLRSEAQKNYTERLAQQEIARAEEKELAEVSGQIIEPVLTDLRTALISRCVEVPGLPIQQFDLQFDSFSPPLMPRRPMQEIIREAHRYAYYRENGPADNAVPFFSCSCGNAPRRFHVCGYVKYSIAPEKGALHFGFYFWCRGDLHGENWAATECVFLSDGTIKDRSSQSLVKVDEVVSRAYSWVMNTKYWDRIVGPRNL